MEVFLGDIEVFHCIVIVSEEEEEEEEEVVVVVVVVVVEEVRERFSKQTAKNEVDAGRDRATPLTSVRHRRRRGTTTC